MKKIFFTIFICSSILFGQAGSSAVPFLLISSSVEANGMGGIMTVANASSPSSMMFNPAQLGISSQTDFLSTEIYSHKTFWLPQFRLSDLWLNNYSLMYGMRLPEEDKSSISVGLGYSRVFLNLGEYVVTSENDPTPIDKFKGYESSDNFSVGVGIDLGFTLAFGTTIKKITSQLSPIGTAEERGSATANVWAIDFGMLGKFPVVDLILNVEEFKRNNLLPFLDFTTAYVINNLGGKVVYFDIEQADPLPRTARLGWSSEVGIKFQSKHIDVSLINITIAREAENMLFKRDEVGSWEYSGAPFGNINIYKHLIASEANGYVTVRRGFSVNFLETVTFRQGSYEGDGNLSYATTGYTISSSGLLKYFNFTKPAYSEPNLLQSLLSHLEIRFSHSEYSGRTLLDGTGFDNFIFTYHY